MTPTSWDAGILTGFDSVDAEHRLQVSLVDALEELVRRGDDPALTARTLAQLADFTDAHFRSEELVMRLYGYPGEAGHRAEHERLTAELAGLRAGAGRADETLRLVGRLRGWLLDHIRSMDQEFARWCRREGIEGS